MDEVPIQCDTIPVQLGVAAVARGSAVLLQEVEARLVAHTASRRMPAHHCTRLAGRRAWPPQTCKYGQEDLEPHVLHHLCVEGTWSMLVGDAEDYSIAGLYVDLLIPSVGY